MGEHGPGMTAWGWRALGRLERRLAAAGAWRELDVIARMSRDELEQLAWAELHDPGGGGHGRNR